MTYEDYKISDIGVYVLECEDDCYYVGASMKLQKRLSDHFSLNGGGWTEKHPPLDIIQTEVIEPTESDEWNQLERRENELTLQYMREYGWESVRGGQWYEPELEQPPLPLQKHENRTIQTEDTSNMDSLQQIADSLL